jgi:zinc transport system permease protein
MDFLIEPLSHGFMLRALFAGAAVGTAGGLLGLFVVQRGLAFLSDGLAHAAFGGIALGFLLGATFEQAPWVALPFTVLVALGIGYVRRRTALGADVATGVFFAVAFALGILFLGFRPASAPAVDVESLLFGSILTVSPEGLALLLLVSGATVLALTLAWSHLAYATFDPELAALSGVGVARLEYMLMATTALTVVAGLRSVGVILVSAFVVIPAATAHLLAARPLAMAATSVALAVGSSVVGLLASYYLNVASGATVVLLLGVAFFLALGLRRN